MTEEQFKKNVASYIEVISVAFTVCGNGSKIHVYSTDGGLDVDHGLLVPGDPVIVALMTHNFNRAAVILGVVAKTYVANNNIARENFNVDIVIEKRDDEVIVKNSLANEDNDRQYRRILMDNDLSTLYKHPDREFCLDILWSLYNKSHSSGIKWVIDYLS